MGKLSKKRATRRNSERAQRATTNGDSKAAIKVEAVSLPGKIWVISCKIRGIGELVKYQGCEPALAQENVNYGLGTILTGIADELDEIGGSPNRI